MGEKKRQARQMDVKSLVSNAIQRAGHLGYSKKTTSDLRAIWEALVIFGQAKGYEEMCPELCERFMRTYDRSDEDVENLSMGRRDRVPCAMRMLTEFSVHGCWKMRSTVVKAPIIPESLSGELDDFLKYCKDWKRLHHSTITNVKRYLLDFILYLDANGLGSWSELSPENISGFVTSLSHLRPRTLKNVLSSMRTFFRYLFSEGLISVDLSLHLPSIRIPQDQHIPSVWTCDEVDALLAQVDRSSPIGKRDYAILLLACRLGMRAGDIRTLQLENINWDKAYISMSQAKTGKPLHLPITQEIGEVLIDYLQHGRPPTEYREIFLRDKAPIQPFSDTCHFFDIIEKHRKRAGISLPSHRGLHTLRHTVASRLLEVDTPFETISDILGHMSQESTRIYAKVNIAALRSVALDPQEVLHA